MAPVNFGNALNSIGSFQGSLQGYLAYGLAALVLVLGIFSTASALWTRQPKSIALKRAAWTTLFVLVLLLVGRWELKVAQSTAPWARTVRQAGALSSFIPRFDFGSD